jgi:hypothetical protein
VLAWATVITDFSAGMTFPEIPDCLRAFRQGIGPIDDWFHFSRLDEIGQGLEIVMTNVREHHAHFLTNERRQEERFERASHWPDPVTLVRPTTSDHDGNPIPL